MTIEEVLDGIFRDASLTVFKKAAPQNAVLPFTVRRSAEAEPLNVLSGYGGITRNDFVFESWAKTEQEAVALRDDVASAVYGAGLNSYRLPDGESAYDEEINAHMSACVFSLWHTPDPSTAG